MANCTGFRAAGAVAALLLAGAAGASDRQPGVLYNNAGEQIGTVQVTDAPKGVLLRVEASKLAPGWHGVHIHARGDCSDKGFATAGPHVHAGDAKAVHGLLVENANEPGDLPNIHVGSDGVLKADLFTGLMSVSGRDGRPALKDADGSALIIHEHADDYQSQPIGGAGARVACAILP